MFSLRGSSGRLALPHSQGRQAVVRGSIVEASAGLPWKRISISGYEILSRCSDATTRAKVLEHAPERAAEDQLAVLDEGLRLFPQNAALAVRVAKLYQQHGYKEHAQEITATARRQATTPAAQRVLAGFKVE